MSRAIKKLGGQSVVLFTSGGPIENILDSLLQKEEINHRAIPVSDWTRESLAVLEESTLQYRFNMEGPFLHEAEWEGSIKIVRQEKPVPDYIVGCGLLPPGVPEDFYARTAQTGRDLGNTRLMSVTVQTHLDTMQLQGPVLITVLEILGLSIFTNRGQHCFRTADKSSAFQPPKSSRQ